MSTTRVCVIGGGPAGIMTVAALKEHCVVQGYERANDLFGQWAGNTDEMTTKHYGSRHSSFYKDLWTNAPKEADMEVPNYPWKGAADLALPSYVEANVVREYLNDYVDHFSVRELIKTYHNVESVTYDSNDKTFQVTVTNVANNETCTEIYDFVVVATGHYSYPKNPTFPGEDTFPGTVMHSHDFTNGADYKDKKVLCIGGSYSAEDIALQCWKKGATAVHITTRRPGGFGYVDWPSTIMEKPILTNISKSTVTFEDGTSEEYDAIIKCTGYVHKFDFLNGDHDMGGNIMVPNGLYKQCISISNPKLWFIGMQNLVYSSPMFQLQAYLLRDTILGKFTIPDQPTRENAWKCDKQEEAKIASVHDAISFQTKYLKELSDITNEAHVDCNDLFFGWFEDKSKSILQFREQNYASVHTGMKGTTDVQWVKHENTTT